MTGEPLGKGTSFAGTVRVIAGMTSDTRWREALRPETRALVDNPPHASEWIALSHEVHLVDVACRGDMRMAHALGWKTFAADLNTVYRVFFKVFSPPFILSRVPQIYLTYYRENGAARVLEQSEGRAVIEVAGTRAHSAAWWETQRGSIHAGAAATRVRTCETRFLKGGGEHDADAHIEVVWTR